MFKYLASLAIVMFGAVSAQATGYGYYVVPQRVIQVERVVTPNVTVKREFVEVPGVQYVTDVHHGQVVEKIVVQKQVQPVVVQRVVVNHHGHAQVQEVLVQKVVVQKQVQKQQNQRRGFFGRRR